MNTLKQKANEARKKILTMVHKAGTSHIASNFSVIDIATVLYSTLKPEDRVVWSAGWKAATIYYFLAQRGEIPMEDLERFAKEEDGKIEYLGLAETNVPGVLVNGGSVGHGLPVAVGHALAKKRLGLPGMVYCICSDGEMNEGTVWESAASAAHHKLDNLRVIVDANGWQAMGKTSEVLSMDVEYDTTLVDKFHSFGWKGIKINGHDHDLLERFLTGVFPKGAPEKPFVIIADTIKGKGVSFMENHLLYHYKHVTDEDYQKAMAELSV